MRNEQEFKALVMQKVREQQYQKQARLQKIRAVTTTLSAICLLVIGAVMITWFVKLNPSVDYGTQDGVFDAAGAPQSFWDRLFSRGSEEEDSWSSSAGNSSAIENGETTDDGTYASDSNESAEAPEEDSNEGSLPVGDAPEGTQSSPSDKGNEDSVGSADSNNPSEGYSPNTGSSNTEESAPSSESGSSVDAEMTVTRVTLEGLSEQTSAMLALENGYTEDAQETAAILDAIHSCMETSAPALIEPGEPLFVLHYGETFAYHFYDNNIFSLQQSGSEKLYEFPPAAFKTLLSTLQNTELTPTH